ncbi:hypothetical protein ACFRCG_41710 [Embleya sp. NPDC056575]|uniref:hypothetical protein n=1 Tax=unclassified Embleya TaxID=2699296 RepID=UPI0036A698BF
MTHLWEVDHPYYCADGNYWATDGANHETYDSWAEFTEETLWFSGDRDLNLLFRWDWKSYRNDPDPDDRSIPDQLCLYFVQQRKANQYSVAIQVTDDDEPAIRAWLDECARTMRALWEPLDLAAA